MAATPGCRRPAEWSVPLKSSGTRVCSRGVGRDRPEAACPPGSRAAVGEAGGFNAVQKVLTNCDLDSVSSDG